MSLGLVGLSKPLSARRAFVVAWIGIVVWKAMTSVDVLSQFCKTIMGCLIAFRRALGEVGSGVNAWRVRSIGAGEKGFWLFDVL